MLEVFEILKHPEISPETESHDKTFRTLVLALLSVSITIQILVSAWFHGKFKMLENHLPPHPIIQSEKLDLSVTLPELVAVDRKIDSLAQRLERGLMYQRALRVPEENTEEKTLSAPARKETELRRSNRVMIVEEINN
jgi:hypothetical protein